MYALKLADPMLFLSTLSLRRATFVPFDVIRPAIDFYPRSPCGERHNRPGLFFQYFSISIHALLAESDHRIRSWLIPRNGNFYPRSPCGERQFKMPVPTCIYSFLSTLSLRRATISSITAEKANSSFLSTLSLRRATTFHQRRCII